MRNEVSYNLVFSEKIPLKCWVSMVNVYKQIDDWLERNRSTKRPSERFLASWRAVLSFFVVSFMFRTFAYTSDQLQSLAETKLEDVDIEACWNQIQSNIAPHNTENASLTIFTRTIEMCHNDLGISCPSGFASIDDKLGNMTRFNSKTINTNIRTQVLSLLPEVFNKSAIVPTIAKSLGIKERQVRKAIDRLIRDGHIIDDGSEKLTMQTIKSVAE